MKTAIDDVTAFHQASGQFVSTDPISLTPYEWEGFNLRLRLIREEFAEVICALEDWGGTTDVEEERDAIAHVAKELVDLIYVCIGAGVTFGLPLDRVWDEVHRSNMAKFSAGVIKDKHGKILKPPGWTPPDIRRVIFGEGG